MEVENKTKNKKKSMIVPILFAWMAVFFCSTSAVFVRYSTAPAVVLATYRKTMVTVMLLPFVLTKYKTELKSLDKKTVKLCCLSGVFLAMHFYTYFLGVQNTSMAASQVLTSTEVIFMAIFMFSTGKERYGKIPTLGIVVAVIGSVIVATAKGGSFGPNVAFGNTMAIVCAVMLTAYSYIGSNVRKFCSNTVYTFIVYGTSAVVLNVLVVISGYSYFGYDSVNFFTAFGMAIFASLLGHSVFNWTLKYLSPTLLAIFKLFQPVLATIWGLILFSEMPTFKHLIGGIVVICGIIVYIKSKGIK